MEPAELSGLEEVVELPRVVACNPGILDLRSDDLLGDQDHPLEANLNPKPVELGVSPSHAGQVEAVAWPDLEMEREAGIRKCITPPALETGSLFGHHHRRDEFIVEPHVRVEVRKRVLIRPLSAESKWAIDWALHR